ncbi:MAG: hypothetical protein ACLQVN_26090 [Bryobacteraceae bacterium]
MTRAWLVLTGFILCGPGPAWAADLNGVHTVYLLNMAHGLDQYLANRLTGDHLFIVVTDPKKADAVITDQLGGNLDATLETIAPSPKPPEKAEAKAREPGDTKGRGDAPAGGSNSLAAAFGGNTNNALEHPVSTFARSKGTIFLVDAKSRQVLWSLYTKPKGTESKDMDRTASGIVSRLRKDMNRKEPKATPAK